MTLIKNTILLIVITTVLISCGGTTHSLSSGQFSKRDNYKINSYYGCCGCEAKYFIINSGKRKVEQIIYSYNCYAKGKPTKFVFNYNKLRRIISCDKYIATTSNDFTLKLSEQEKSLFYTVDTSSLTKANFTTVKLSEIKGFRKPIDNEITHSFPLIKKGSKLTVQ
jgi:hypothetical protein